MTDDNNKIKLYAHAIGGLGDHFTQYFGRHVTHTDLGYITDVKKFNPNVYIKIISHSTLPEEVKSFFQYHPYVDEVDTLKWATPNEGRCPWEKREAGPGFACITDYAIINNIPRNKQLKVFTSPEDEQIIKGITSKGPYVLLHPFSTDLNRIALPKSEYEKLALRITRKFNCNVVVVGKSHVKHRKRISLNRTESFDISAPNIINLVDKTNIRISAKLAFLAKGVVANNSIYNCLLAGGTVPITLLKPNNRNMSGMKKLFHTVKHARVINTSIDTKTVIARILKDLERRIFNESEA